MAPQQITAVYEILHYQGGLSGGAAYHAVRFEAGGTELIAVVFEGGPAAVLERLREGADHGLVAYRSGPFEAELREIVADWEASGRVQGGWRT